MRPPVWVMILVTLLLGNAAGVAQTDLPVYGDSLLSGFQDEHWTSHNLANTSPVRSGSFSISVAPASAWEGIEFRHAEFDTTPYASVSFWVHGGPLGGQRLQIQGLLGRSNPSPEVYYRCTLAPDAWQQVVVPLSALGLAKKTNCSGFWIQLTPNGRTNTFYLDDVQFSADSPAAPRAARAAPPAPAEPAREAGASNWSAAAWCIAATLLVITGLLTWLILLLRRSGLGTSQALVPLGADGRPQPGGPADGDGKWRGLNAALDPETQAVRDQMAANLADFAKQSLVQGLYSQRGKLLETERLARTELAELEARLTALHLPLQERVRAYETRIIDLEKQLETRDDEMRNMIQATLSLVRERLEQEKSEDDVPRRFN